MKITCPSCSAEYPIEAGLLEDEGKRLAALLADLEPVLARAAIAYLRLFKPAGAGLRTAAAVKLLQELSALVKAGRVSRDGNDAFRPATSLMWSQGIEQMLQQRSTLKTPLSNHNYLRAIVFAAADAHDAKQEKHKEQALRSSPRAGSTTTDQLRTHLDWLAEQLRLGRITHAEHDSAADATRARHGVAEK